MTGRERGPAPVRERAHIHEGSPDDQKVTVAWFEQTEVPASHT